MLLSEVRDCQTKSGSVSDVEYVLSVVDQKDPGDSKTQAIVVYGYPP